MDTRRRHKTVRLRRRPHVVGIDRGWPSSEDRLEQITTNVIAYNPGQTVASVQLHVTRENDDAKG